MTETAVRRSAFGPLTIAHDARVLTPRPWTYAQSHWAAELAQGLPAGAILELCAGAGQIGLAAAVESGRDLVQVEADPVAAEFARHNAEACGWDGRTEVRVDSLEAAVAPDERFPVVLADPPYLPSAQVSSWPEDPVRAIDGGPDGLAVVQLCLAVAAHALLPGGALLLQVAGPAQADAVTALLPATGLGTREVRVTDAERAIMLIGRS